MYFTAVVLICAMATPVTECDERSALDVMPHRVASEMSCALNWQQTIAGGALREGIGQTLYMKTLCRRERGGVLGARQ